MRMTTHATAMTGVQGSAQYRRKKYRPVRFAKLDA
jgi:hypothetical protein